MSTFTVSAIMVHVTNVHDALAWYHRAFPGAVRRRLGIPEFEILFVGDVQLEFVPADTKVSSGPCGTVVYWQVPSFEETLEHFQSLGARLYRGPMQIEGGQLMCQVQDPWGNCIGLRGPAKVQPPE